MRVRGSISALSSHCDGMWSAVVAHHDPMQICAGVALPKAAAASWHAHDFDLETWTLVTTQNTRRASAETPELFLLEAHNKRVLIARDVDKMRVRFVSPLGAVSLQYE